MFVFFFSLFVTDVKEKVRSFIAVANAKVSFPVAERTHFRRVLQFALSVKSLQT